MMPPGPGHAMPGPHGPRSSKGLVIGLGVGAVAVAGIVAAAVLATGGGGGGGVGSREDLVKRTLAALGEGDVDRLVKLSDPVRLYELALDCSERDKKRDADKDKARDGGDDDRGTDDDLDDDPQLQAKRARRQFEKLVDKTKGMKVELVSIAGEGDDKDGADPDGKRKKTLGMKKGDKIKGCVVKVDVQIREVAAKVRVTAPDGKEPVEQKTVFTAIEAGGSWFLATPPRLGGGGGTVVGGGGPLGGGGSTIASDGDDTGGASEVKQALARMGRFKATMCACADQACVLRVQKEMADWAASMSRKARDQKPPRAEDMDDLKRVSDLAREITECAAKAIAAGTGARSPDDPPPPVDPASDPASSGGGPDLASLPACADLHEQIEKIRACPKYPPTTADTVRQSWTQLERTWASSRSSQGTRQQMTAACEAFGSSVKKTLASICP